MIGYHSAMIQWKISELHIIDGTHQTTGSPQQEMATRPTPNQEGQGEQEVDEDEPWPDRWNT